MKLHLKYEPVPPNAARFASDIAEIAKRIDGVELDYSPDSLRAVDDLIERFHAERLTPDQVGETLFGFGCYVGEVFVRTVGGRWRLAEDTPMRGFAGVQLVIEIPGVRYVNPIGKVFKRLENGREDALPYFYTVFAAPPASTTGTDGSGDPPPTNEKPQKP